MPSPAVQPLLALLASHVGGNPLQYMYEKAFVHHDLDWRYMTFEITPESLGDAIRGMKAMGFRGGHCDAIHKQAVSAWLDRVTETAAMVGAVNLIFREGNELVGENTEGRGLVQAIRGVLDPAGKNIVLLGAGRMARAAAVELAAAGVAGITVVNRTEAHAQELQAMVAGKFATPVTVVPWNDECSIPPDADILINAAGLGREAESRLPLAADSLRPELLAVDVTADSPHAWLLEEAARRGGKTVDGLSIFIEQAVIGFQQWTGVEPNRQVLREAVEEFWEL